MRPVDRLRQLTGDRRTRRLTFDSSARTLRRLWDDRHTASMAVAATFLGTLILPVAGPVAALTAIGYLLLADALWRRNRAARLADAARDDARGAIDLLAADLRSGSVAPNLFADTIARVDKSADPACRRMARRLAAVAGIAAQAGIPAADLIGRLAADERARARTRRRLLAQTAGTTASTWLLAGLPLAGIALGQAIGAQPLRMLFGTPAGAACLALAATLQIAGSVWAGRIGATAVATIEGGAR